MANTDDIYGDFKFLDIYPHKYILRQNDVLETVVLDLISGKVTHEKIIESGDKKKTIGLKAVYGILELEKAKYLIVCTKSNIVGSIYNKRIFQAKKMEIFPINPDQKIKEQDQKYISMINDLFNTNCFYFSDQYDLTNSFQTFIDNNCDKNKFNASYCYNENALQPLIKVGAFEWISPFINGFVSFDYVNMNNNQKRFEFILISRRDKRRVGMRFMSRGTDLDGNCSNMAQQESLIVLTQTQYDKEIASVYSYVQTRGSMPFKWRQTPTLKWAPKGYIVGNDQENQHYCKRHFEDQTKQFPKQALLNLVDKKGTQKLLGSYFEKMVSGLNNKDIKYIWFDFHAECKKMKYENLSRLLAQVKSELKDYGYFHMQYNLSVPTEVETHKRQIGVFRTNCMDCLDRTNVVQSVLARQLIHQILHSAGLLETPSGDPFQKFPDVLEETFRQVWTKNADIMSILYSGTGALKTDFTRTGRRTKQGALQDGKNSIHRYVLNNFFDAHKQNSYQLLLGKLDPKKEKYQKPLVNPVFMLLFTLIAGYFFIQNLSAKYLTPVFLNDSQIQENIQRNQTIHHGGFSQWISEFIVIVSGLVILLKGIQIGNKAFVPKPIIKN